MTLKLDLPANLADLLRAEAEKHGQDVSDFVRPALENLVRGEATVARLNGQHPTSEQLPPDASSNHSPQPLANSLSSEKTIGEVLDEIWKDIPAEELAKIPSDLSENLDHYIYGTKKRT